MAHSSRLAILAFAAFLIVFALGSTNVGQSAPSVATALLSSPMLVLGIIILWVFGRGRFR